MTGPDQKYARCFFGQMMEAIRYLHSTGLKHRDLKPANLMFSNNFEIKVVDFGLATKAGGMVKSNVGTQGYKPNEMYEGVPHMAEAVDVFALGVILFNMVTGRPPFATAENRDRQYRKLLTDPEAYWKSYSKFNLSGDLKLLLEAMLKKDPSERITVGEIMEHPWYKNAEQPTQDEVTTYFGRLSQK